LIVPDLSKNTLIIFFTIFLLKKIFNFEFFKKSQSLPKKWKNLGKIFLFRIFFSFFEKFLPGSPRTDNLLLNLTWKEAFEKIIFFLGEEAKKVFHRVSSVFLIRSTSSGRKSMRKNNLL